MSTPKQTSNKLPKMYDISTLLQAGIDPKTGLPLKLTGSRDCELKTNIKRQLRILDEQDAVNKYVWYNLPSNISSQELERMLYYKSQLCFFYNKDLEQFYFMPYALDGTIDFYGRYNTIHPVPFTSGTEDKNGKAQAQYLSNIKLNVVYGIKQPWELEEKDLYDSAVILRDYTPQLAQTSLARCELNEPVLDTMAECIPYMRTALINSTGVKGMRVPDADSALNVYNANKTIREAALNGETMTPIESKVDFQDLTNGATAKGEEFMLAMQSLDNYRLSTHGIDNGGLFDKKAQMLQSEFDINGGPVGLVLQDGLSWRQNFALIANSIWGTSIWCEVAETISKTDVNGDGVLYDRKDAATSNVEPKQQEEASENEQ